MSNELYIAGQKIDIDESQVIALTRQISEIGEIKSRQSNLTNTFRTKDEKSLSFASIPGSKTKYPYRFLPARLVQNGFEIIRNGNAMIKSSGEKGTDITIYWGNNDFFDRLNFQLSELDLSELNHNYDMDMGMLIQTDVFYPFIEFGGNSTYRYYDANQDRNYIIQDISKSYPAVYVRRIWDEIFNKIGFTYSLNHNPIFKRQALQLTTRKGLIVDKSPYLVSSQNTTEGTGTFFRWLHSNIVTGNDTYFPRSGFANATEVYVNATGFRAVFKFRINLNADFIKGSENGSLRFSVTSIKTLNGNTFTTELFSTTFTDNFFGTQILEFELDLATTHSSTDLSQNKNFRMAFQTTLDGSEIIIRSGSTFQLIDFEMPEIEIGDEYNVSHNMPEITAYEFIQNIARQYGMIFDTKGRHVNIVTYDDVLLSKLDKKVLELNPLPGSIQHEFNPGSYYQVNEISYSEGVDTVATFEIDNKTLSKRGELFKLDFYLPGFTEKAEVGRILFIPVFDDVQNKKNEFKVPPVFLVNVIDVDSSTDEIVPAYANSQSASSRSIPQKYYRARLEETIGRRRRSEGDNLSRGVTPQAILDINYQSLLNILDDFVISTISVKMNEQQFFGLELYQAYYVPLLRSYRYIQKISNFVKDKETKITLVKI